MGIIKKKEKTLYIVTNLTIDEITIDDTIKWMTDMSKIKLISDVEELQLFINTVNEIDSIFNDIQADAYNAKSCNTLDKDINDRYVEISSKIQNNITPIYHIISKNIRDCEAFDSWMLKYPEVGKLFKSELDISIDSYRKENTKLELEAQTLRNEYESLVAAVMINYNGKENTIPEMGIYATNKDRSIREGAFFATRNELVKLEPAINDILTKLVDIRTKIATNSGYNNYSEYSHVMRGKYLSYTIEDVKEFHDAIAEELSEIKTEWQNERKEYLQVDTLRPWDLGVDLCDSELKPFEDMKNFIPKHIEVMTLLDSEFGKNTTHMNDSNLLDLESRPGKQMGGYSYPLNKYGASFIFMNAVGKHDDIETFTHELGHAFHEFYQVGSRRNFKYIMGHRSESCELASMSMEFFCMPFWNVFYQNKDELIQSKRDKLKGSLGRLSWIMVIDAFQQDLYTNPNTVEAREESFKKLHNKFLNLTIDYSGLEKFSNIEWQMQLHIFSHPFYYIEYAIAQLGAISMYKQYKENPVKTIENYKNFMSVGNQMGLKEQYELAGIELNFSKEYIKELVEFIKSELKELDK